MKKIILIGALLSIMTSCHQKAVVEEITVQSVDTVFLYRLKCEDGSVEFRNWTKTGWNYKVGDEVTVIK